MLSCVAPRSALHAQQRGGRGAAPPGPPPTGQGVAPIDLTGYWVSMIVDEWRFRVSPQKGDIAYLPLNAEARQVANAWDPAKDEADGKACKAYGAVGVMQRPGRLHITWDNPNTLKIEADAGTQTRVIHFGPAPAQPGPPSWQGYSTANWRVNGRVLIDTGGIGFVPALRQSGTSTSGTLTVVTTNMLPGLHPQERRAVQRQGGVDRTRQPADRTAERRLSLGHGDGRGSDLSDAAIRQNLHVQETGGRGRLGSDAVLEPVDSGPGRAGRTGRAEKAGGTSDNS